MEFKTGSFWHQGLFLQPQHFQRLELHQHFLRKPLFEMAHPHFWGVGHLEFAPDSLSARSVEIRSARLLFRDRTYIEFPGNAVISPRSFDKIWKDTDQPLDLYLGLKKLSTVSPNVTITDSFAAAGTASTRFASESDGEPTPDFLGEGPLATIPVVMHVVRIFFGSELESLDDYDLIPVGRLMRDNDIVKLSHDCIPPCYAMAGSTVLQELLRDVRDDLSGRLRQLAEYKAPREIQRQETDPDYFILLQSLQALNRSVPWLNHLTETDQVHPWEVYGFLRSCVGEISTFSDTFDTNGRRRDGNDEGLPGYDHLNPYACFSAARRVINQLLTEISVGPEFRVTLEPDGDYLTASVPLDFFASRNRFYLVVQTTSRNDYSSEDFVHTARLAALQALPTMIAHALPGIDMIEISTPPQGLPQRSGARYYRIEQMSADWEQVEHSGDIGLFWPDAPADARAQLVILRG